MATETEMATTTDVTMSKGQANVTVMLLTDAEITVTIPKMFQESVNYLTSTHKLSEFHASFLLHTIQNCINYVCQTLKDPRTVNYSQNNSQDKELAYQLSDELIVVLTQVIQEQSAQTQNLIIDILITSVSKCECGTSDVKFKDYLVNKIQKLKN